MQKIRYIEIPNPRKGNGLRYGQAALDLINAVRTELHALDMQLWEKFGHDVKGVPPSCLRRWSRRGSRRNVDLWGCRMVALFRLCDENRTSLWEAHLVHCLHGEGMAHTASQRGIKQCSH